MNKTVRKKKHKKGLAAVFALAWCAQGCGLESGSIMEELELPTFGGDRGAGDQSLEVPPDLDSPEANGEYDIASARETASGAAPAARVLPPRLDMRLRSEGNVTWLAVSATPGGLWPHLIDFWRSHGFEITGESALHGRLETGWREQRPSGAFAAQFRVRDMFLMRLERAPDAVTNVYLANRKATLAGGDWRFAFSDHETEVGVLYDLRDYLAALREVRRVEMPPLEDVRIALDIRNLDGAPALTVGQPYSRVWRRLGVALDRAGLSVRRADRSRGVYLIRYLRAKTDDDFAEAAGSRLLQVRLLSRGNRTLVTVHVNRKRGAALSYETAHEVLHRIVRMYQVHA